MEKYHGNTVEYWKQNAEEDYIKTPISVLKYITILEEQSEQLRKHDVVWQSEQLKAFLLYIQENAPNYRTKQLKPDQVIKAYLESL